MAGEEDNSDIGGVFLTEYIMISILLRLPIASCIARFRCVCRSWRILLSDPQFIRRILIFNSDHQNKSSSSLQILITGVRDDTTPEHLRSNHYSLLSYHTLRPISSWGDLPSSHQSSWDHLVVADSCDGILCLVEDNCNPDGGAPGVILWNPTTSETKFMPASTSSPRRNLYSHQQTTCFGFDPQTNDYKVARILCFDDLYNDAYDLYDGNGAEYMTENLDAITYAEIYSLRNKSWKRLAIDDVRLPLRSDGAHYLDVHPQQRGNHSRWWFYAICEFCFTLSFDMTEEAFKSTTIPLPPPLRHVSEFDSSYCQLSGCFMLKDSLHATFYHFGDQRSYSVWCLLKHPVADSWTKLYTFTTSSRWTLEFLQVWKEDTYICSRQRRFLVNDPDQEGGGGGATNDDDDDNEEEENKVFIFSQATGNIVDRIEIQGRKPPFQAHIFTPTQISLSDFLGEQ